MPPYSEDNPSAAGGGGDASILDSPPTTPDDGIIRTALLQPSMSFTGSDSSYTTTTTTTSTNTDTDTEPPRPSTPGPPRRSRGESMRAGSKGARDFFGRERALSAFRRRRRRLILVVRCDFRRRTTVVDAGAGAAHSSVEGRIHPGGFQGRPELLRRFASRLERGV